MASCGWCKTKGLSKVKDTGDGHILEKHLKPGTRTQCAGPGTTFIRKR